MTASGEDEMHGILPNSSLFDTEHSGGNTSGYENEVTTKVIKACAKMVEEVQMMRIEVQQEVSSLCTRIADEATMSSSLLQEGNGPWKIRDELHKSIAAVIAKEIRAFIKSQDVRADSRTMKAPASRRHSDVHRHAVPIPSHASGHSERPQSGPSPGIRPVHFTNMPMTFRRVAVGQAISEAEHELFGGHGSMEGGDAIDAKTHDDLSSCHSDHDPSRKPRRESKLVKLGALVAGGIAGAVGRNTSPSPDSPKGKPDASATHRIDRVADAWAHKDTDVESSRSASEAAEEELSKLGAQHVKNTESDDMMVVAASNPISAPSIPTSLYAEEPESWIHRTVGSPQFAYVSGALVLINAITIGAQTDYHATHIGKGQPQFFRITDAIFCIVFAVEIGMRIAAYKWAFLYASGWTWNVFDGFLVAMQIGEEIIALFVNNFGGYNISFLRVLRVLRLVRIVRIVRVLRLIQELRTIVSSIGGSLKSLGWTVILLFLMIYVVGVCLTQLVLDHRNSHPHDGSQEYSDLEKYYGSLLRSILSLYEAISGGVDWDQIVTPLIDLISPLAGLLFTFYIAFAVLALMNVVTGVFVESALKSAKEDRDQYLLNQVRRLFHSTSTAQTGKIDWAMFEKKLEEKEMREFFLSIDVDISEARSVFNLLDVDSSGTIELDEFLNGCLGLHGPAKALELSALMYETRNLSHSFTTYANHTEQCIADILNVLVGTHSSIHTPRHSQPLNPFFQKQSSPAFSDVTTGKTDDATNADDDVADVLVGRSSSLLGAHGDRRSRNSEGPPTQKYESNVLVIKKCPASRSSQSGGLP